MKKYKKKPVVIEAVQYDGTNEKEIYEFLGDTVLSNDKGLLIPTLEGTMEVSVGDYIIKGVKGEFYPCKPDIFEKTYEETEESRFEDIDKKMWHPFKEEQNV